MLEKIPTNASQPASLLTAAKPAAWIVDRGAPASRSSSGVPPRHFSRRRRTPLSTTSARSPTNGRPPSRGRDAARPPRRADDARSRVTAGDLDPGELVGLDETIAEEAKASRAASTRSTASARSSRTPTRGSSTSRRRRRRGGAPLLEARRGRDRVLARPRGGLRGPTEEPRRARPVSNWTRMEWERIVIAAVVIGTRPGRRAPDRPPDGPPAARSRGGDALPRAAPQRLDDHVVVGILSALLTIPEVRAVAGGVPRLRRRSSASSSAWPRSGRSRTSSPGS